MSIECDSKTAFTDYVTVQYYFFFSFEENSELFFKSTVLLRGDV